VQQIFQKMSDADLLIFATPVYVFGISVLLKTLLDRTHGISDSTKLILSKSGLIFHHTNKRFDDIFNHKRENEPAKSD